MSVANSCNLGQGSDIFNLPCDASTPGGGSVQISQGTGIECTPNPITAIGSVALSSLTEEKINLSRYNGVTVPPVISINTPTTFDLSAGVLRFYDFTTVSGGGVPVETILNFAGVTNVLGSLLGSGTESVTYLSINSVGSVIQRNREITPLESNTEILIGNLDHTPGPLTTFFQTTQSAHSCYSIEETVRQFVRSRGGISISGMEFTAVSLTLSVQNTEGIGLRFGSNHGANNPDLIVGPSQNPTSLRLVYTDNLGVFQVSGTTNFLDVANYVNSGVLTAMTPNRFQILRVFYAYGSDTSFIYYGNAEYGTINDAIAAINTEEWSENPDSFVGAPVAIIIAGEGGTDTSDPASFRFIKLGGIRSGADLGSATANVSLQSAYQNGASIITNMGDGTVLIDDGSAGALTQFSVRDQTSASVFDVNNTQTNVKIANCGGLGALAVGLQPYGVGAGQTGEIRFQELLANGTEYVGFKAPDALAAPLIWTLPTILGTSGDVLTRSAGNTLTWVAPAGGGGASRGFHTQVGGSSIIIPPTALTVVIFPSENFDDNNDYNNATGIYTAPTAGLYQFNASVVFSTSAGGDVQIAIARNGVEISHDGWHAPVAVIAGGAACSVTYRLLQFDTVRLQCFNSTGFNISLSSGGGGQNHFSGCKLS